MNALVHCPGTKTGEEEAVLFLFLTALLGVEKTEAVHATVNEWWCRINMSRQHVTR